MVTINILPQLSVFGRKQSSHREMVTGVRQTSFNSILHSPGLCLSPSLTVLVKQASTHVSLTKLVELWGSCARVCVSSRVSNKIIS